MFGMELFNEAVDTDLTEAEQALEQTKKLDGKPPPMPEDQEKEGQAFKDMYILDPSKRNWVDIYHKEFLFDALENQRHPILEFCSTVYRADVDELYRLYDTIARVILLAEFSLSVWFDFLHDWNEISAIEIRTFSILVVFFWFLFSFFRVATDVEAHKSEIADEIKFCYPLRLLSWICDALVEKEDEVLNEHVVCLTRDWLVGT